MTVRSDVDDDLWFATGDPTRRQVIELLLARGGGTATSVSERLPVTRQAVARHLGVLADVGLVRATAVGRQRIYRVDEPRMAQAVAQLARVSQAWDARLDRIKRIAERLSAEPGEPSHRTVREPDRDEGPSQDRDE